jgi:uncharacterized repeat protein (TIGR03837 family)
MVHETPRHWHLFCRVVDNLGDAGVCWRLARQLAAEHALDVTLWIDDLKALTRLAPETAVCRIGPDRVSVRHWDDAASFATLAADVVVAAFAADLPEPVRASMRMRPHPPAWINLEYLSAEPWVSTHHALPSPKPDGLIEHFFFPGFAPDTGGLLREAGLLDRRDRFSADVTARAGWLASLGVVPEAGERLLSLFCYPEARTHALLEALAMSGERWRVLVPAGVAPTLAATSHPDTTAVRTPRTPTTTAARAPSVPTTTSPTGRRPAVQRIPFVPQQQYDRLLWCCDANLVRGEDSLVRALWSGRPFLWQAYPQDGHAHLPKVEALIGRWLDDARPAARAAAAFAAAQRAWNGDDAGHGTDAIAQWLSEAAELDAAARRWGGTHDRPGDDLASRLVRFAADRL